MSRGALAGWAATLACVGALYAPITLGADGRAGYATLLWVVAPFLALSTWLLAASTTSGRVRVAFGTIAVAAGLALVAQFSWAAETHLLHRPDVPAAAYLFLLPYLVLAAGVALSLGSRRGREWDADMTVDAALLMLAATVLTFRLVLEPFRVRIEVTGGGALLIAGFQLVALLPLFPAALLVLRRGSVLAPVSAAALMAATTAFAVGAMLALGGGGTQPFAANEPTGYVWVAGWLLLAFSGLAARDVPSTADAMLARRRPHDAIRRRIAPFGAVVLAGVATDVALRPPARVETVLAMAALGVVLALRTAHAFEMADREADQRRQLEQTRALVRVTHAVAGTKDLDAALDVISRSASEALRTRAAGIELISDDGAAMVIHAAFGLPDGVVGRRSPVQGSFTGWVVVNGEPRATADPSADPTVQRESLDFLGRSPAAAAPLRFRGQTLGVLFACTRSEPFDAEELKLLSALAEQAAIIIQNARLIEQVTTLSITDPLTGLSNRRQLERELEREFAAARRGRDLVAVIFDLDDFKGYNDTHGHLAGDQALQAFGRALSEESRLMNFAARYGGDEFVALLSETGTAGGAKFVERVRKKFRAAVRALGHGEVTVSAGIAAYRPEMESPETLLRAADDALYSVKPRLRT